MVKKYYAVKVGKSTGIYNNWEDCKKQVTGFSGAIYKSFPTLEEAKEYLNNGNVENEVNSFNLENIADDEILAYVDGSYKKDTLEYGYGVVLILKDDIIEFFGKGENPEVAKSRNVTGELFGSIRAISEAIRLKKKKITVFYDYQGISSWANGEWKCNLPLTIGYKDKIRDFRKEIEILFVKVKAHSNDKYNDLADHLAKKSLEIEK
ncbi:MULTISPECIES: ribonuclease H family protein [unclassified Parvimonas]|uniref:ribonuclease H family protein n=1 Tax=unclassified Parvimonas TaxID=1151464 RepID=UPI002B46A99F|nr:MULTISPECIES: ribonuclease H family protein [unclassified Parvimonas]MEB3024432.1 ribonuclease H family protein [Parvimonas sp. M13]MEB3088738.1 ribonuclease H family protein [Parvimonas sp. M20]